MMKRIVLAFILMLLISSINFSVCADVGQSGASTVDIKGFSFQPDSIAVQAGTAVTWVNRDSVDHTITSDNGKFDSGNIMSGGEFKFVLSQPGSYSYHCAIHPSMTGIVTVTSTSDQKDNVQTAAMDSNASQQSGSSPPVTATSSPAAKQPGFEGVFAVASILVAGYVLSARKP